MSIIIRTQIDGSFLFLSFAINVCCLVTLALLFIPKVKHILKHTAEEDSIKQEADSSSEQQKKDKYAKLLKENDELNQQLAKVKLIIE